MPINFNTSILAASAQRALDNSTRRLTLSFERLSSGMRINRASDDPAGLAVSSSLNTENRVFNRAVRNINDGISGLNLLDSTYTAASSLLQRMGELASQSANGSLSSTQRSALNLEYQQLDAEIRRLAKQTSFNGVQLADGKQSARSATSISSTNPSSILGVSGDGRVITYVANSRIEQLDTVSGATTVLTGTLSGSISGKASAGGNLIAFTTTSDLTGQNSSNRAQVFVLDRASGTTKQVTSNSSAGASYTINTISDDGSALLYIRNETFTNFYYIYQTQPATSTLLSSVVAGSNETWAFSADGRYLATVNDFDLDGEYDLYRYQVGQPVSSLQKLTDFFGQGYVSPLDTELAVDNSGKIFFFSTADLVGQNSSGKYQLYTLSTNGTFKQLGNNTANATLSQLRVTADGSAAVFLGTSNYGSNSSGNTQLFRYELAEGRMDQKTNYTANTLGSATSGKIALDGNSIVYASSGLKQIDLSPTAYDLTIDLGIRGSNGTITALLDSINGSLRGLGATLISTQAAAKGAIDTVSRNIDQLGIIRGNLGAYMSRLETAESVIRARAQDGEAAKSRIVDADYAQEAANALKENILRQTSSAMLAQSKGAAQIALQLLQGSLS